MTGYCIGVFATQLNKQDVERLNYDLIEDAELPYWSIALRENGKSVAVSELTAYVLKQIKDFSESDEKERLVELPVAEFVPNLQKILKSWGLKPWGKTATSDYFLIKRSCVPVNITYDYIRKELDNGKKLVCR